MEAKVVSIYVYKVSNDNGRPGFCVSGEKQGDRVAAYSGHCFTISEAAGYMNSWLQHRLSENADFEWRIFFVHPQGSHVHVSRHGRCSYSALSESEVEEFQRAIVTGVFKLSQSLA